MNRVASTESHVDASKDAFLETYSQAPRIAEEFASHVHSRPWRLELTKSVLSEGFPILVASVEKPAPWSWRARIARFSSQEEGHSRIEQILSGGLLIGRYTCSSIIASLVWIHSVLRSGLPRDIKAIDGRTLVVAVHPEITNRTRHVLSMAARSGRPVIVLLLGRPKTSVRMATRIFSEFEFESLRVVRPLDAVSGLAAIPEAVRSVWLGLLSIAQTGYVPPFRSEVASIYRVLLGKAHETWCARNLSPIDAVYFGHTGTADCDGLERGLQKNGSRTVHCVHGIAGGWNFAAGSDLGVFLCGFDSVLYARYGTYGRTASRPSSLRIPYRRGLEGWLVATNYVHPTNPFVQHGAHDFEKEMIVGVALAAGKRGLDPSKILWRPHPAFWSMPESTTAPLLEMALDLGIRISARTDAPPNLSSFAAVICCPTTVVIDALGEGVLPIVYSPSPLSGDVVYSALPTFARTRKELEEQLDELDNLATAQRKYEESLAHVRPSQHDWDIGWLEEVLNKR